MGTCCTAHLAAKVRDYASKSDNGAVTVTVIENPRTRNHQPKCGYVIGRDYPTDLSISCENIAEFALSYFEKKG